jgi:hypothetical protein
MAAYRSDPIQNTGGELMLFVCIRVWIRRQMRRTWSFIRYESKEEQRWYQCDA